MTPRLACILVTGLGVGTAIPSHLFPSDPPPPCTRQDFGRSTSDIVNVFRRAGEDSTPLRTLEGDRTGLCSPSDVAIDAQGRLHVLNGHFIMVYERNTTGDVAPIREIRLPTGMNIARGFGLDRRGNIYVGTDESAVPDNGSITVHAPGLARGQPPRLILAGGRTGLRRPVGIALDPGGGLYASVAGDSVLMFARGATGDVAPVKVLAGPATGLRGPSGLAVDRRGFLYVANSNKNTITVYGPGSAGNVPPVRTIESGAAPPWLQSPSALALDAHDTLYVATSGTINVYPPEARGRVVPVRAVKGVSWPRGLAVGRDRTLYLAQRGKVFVFAPGATDSAVPARTIDSDSARHDAFGLALGPGDTLYVTDHMGAAVTVHPPGARGDAPRRILDSLSSRLSEPMGIAVDSHGNVYVANAPQRNIPGAIRVYGPTAKGDASPIRLYTGRMARPDELADVGVDSRGDMYVLRREGRITVYRPGAGSNPAPIRTIAGPNTLLRQPIRLAFGRNDTLYVLNGFNMWKYGTENVTVTVYAPRAEGDIEPVRSIIVTSGRRSKGSKVGLRWPTGIAVDSRGSVYVSNYFSAGVVAVYPPGATGDVQPARLLRPWAADTSVGRWPGLGPSAVAIGPQDEIFVASVPQPTVFTLGDPDRQGKREAIYDRLRTFAQSKYDGTGRAWK